MAKKDLLLRKKPPHTTALPTPMHGHHRRHALPTPPLVLLHQER